MLTAHYIGIYVYVDPQHASKDSKIKKKEQLISLRMHSFCLEGNTFRWDTASRLKKSSSSCSRIALQSLSTVNIPVSCLSSRVLEYGKGNIAVHHKKRRRVDSVVTTEAFRPRRPEEFFKRQSFQRKFLGENKNVLPEKIISSCFHCNPHILTGMFSQIWNILATSSSSVLQFMNLFDTIRVERYCTTICVA